MAMITLKIFLFAKFDQWNMLTTKTYILITQI